MQSQSPHLTAEMQRLLAAAQDEAARRHGVYVDIEHLALALLNEPAGPARDILADSGADRGALYDQIASAIGMERSTRIEVKELSRAARQALTNALEVARSLGQGAVNSGHLLVAMLESGEGIVREALDASPVSASAARDYLRAHPPATSAPVPGSSPRAPQRPPQAPEAVEYVLIPTRDRRRPKDPSRQTWLDRLGRWPLILGGLVAFFAYLFIALPGNAMTTFFIVIVGWVFSVTLHEFSHAIVAYWGGDYTVRDKGYLSFNPLKYTHPMLSIGLPLLFLAMGGIGLPGGAVYIERHRLKNKWWGAAVSAAGPAANVVLAVLLALPFLLGLVDPRTIFWSIQGMPVEGEGIWTNATLWTAAAFLVMLQVTAVLFNLIPVPPLDGFGIIEPFLDRRTQLQLRQLGSYTLMLIFLALWFIPPVAESFWNTIFSVTDALNIPGWLINEGFRNFMFWVPRG
jgi:Zn-dependent protease